MSVLTAERSGTTAKTGGPPPSAPGEYVIRPRRGWIAVDWRELIEHRELLYFLVQRDIKVRYKQTVLGVAWAVLQPLITTLIFTAVFGTMANVKFSGLPYAVAVFAGQWPWTFFSNSVSQAGLSLVNQQALLTKIYLPRLMVPASNVAAGLVDMAIASSVMIGLMIFFRIAPGWGLLALPAIVLLTAALATGVGLTLAALTVSYRDFKHLIPFMLQAWLFLSPVVYPTPESWRPIMMFNPMTGIVEAYRSSLLGQAWQTDSLAISVVMSAAILLFGVYFFRRTERRFADVV